jgi:Zn-finger nucleic acid-binding protein
MGQNQGNYLTMPAETLNCPMCGAAAASDASHCEHCGARLATVACPSCFGMMFAGAKFCSHCGAKADRTEVTAETHEQCPRCKTEMEHVLVGKTQIEECPRCEGIWADAESVREICANQEQQAAVLGLPTSTPAPELGNIEQHIHYVPCPVCHNLMNRVNFAHCSAVVVNVCNQHGTWFDKDQLRRVVEFIRGGGLEKRRARELEELDDRRRSINNQAPAGTWEAGESPMSLNTSLQDAAVSAIVSVVSSLFRL